MSQPEGAIVPDSIATTDEEARSSIRPVTSRSTVDLVTEELRRAIMTGVLPAGETFSTAQLAATLNVSHIPVREGLRALEAQGLVQLRQGRRARVSPIDVGEVEDAYRLWILICDDVLARARGRFAPEQLDDLAAKLDAFSALDRTDERAFELHQEFHLGLLAPGATTWDLRLLNQLWHVIERAVRKAYANPLHQEESTYEAHAPLLAAASTGDSKRLRRALREHQEDHQRAVIDLLTPHD
jgi:DNA-binding GntR family transcriptional regulator